MRSATGFLLVAVLVTAFGAGGCKPAEEPETAAPPVAQPRPGEPRTVADDYPGAGGESSAPAGPIEWTTNYAEGVAQAQAEGKPVMMDLYADWCGPCRMLSPILDEVANEANGARVVKVNVDQVPQLAAQYGVSSIPSLKVFKRGEVVAQHVGLADKAYLKSMLE